ncbi:MAG: FISUMP domain-containing protein [Candidatus Saccharibacteria bacterium]|nr:FISUMP domain-containing protein [Candidatus Saccharibacteria bacterium]
MKKKVSTYIKQHNIARKLSYISSTVFILLALAIFFPLGKGEQTTEAVDGTTSTTDSSLSIVFSSTIASVDLVVDNENGTFVSSKDTNTNIKFRISTTNYSGYTLSLTRNIDNSGNLIGSSINTETGTYNILKHLTSPVAEESFRNPSSTQLNGYWGMEFNNSGSYVPPILYDFTPLDKTDTYNTTANNYTIAVGARAGYDTPINVYKDSFDLVAIANMIELPSIQDYTISQCQDEAADAPVSLLDVRDNSVYTVRYIEGNCWMTQNLALSPGTVLTSDDSNIVAGATYTVPASWDFKATEGYIYLANQEAINNSAISSGGVYSPDQINPVDTGNYYNYCTATAGEICYDATDSLTQNSATQDICPAGWRLPTYEEAVSLGGAVTENGINSASKFSPIYSGRVNYNDSLLYVGTMGNWWTSTAQDDTNRWYMGYYNGNLRTTGYYNRGYGTSVRCIKQIKYMQSYTLGQCQKEAAKKPVSLVDNRDGKEYTARYINGSCWMTQNLDLAGATTITSEDSNITTASYTLPASTGGSSEDAWVDSYTEAYMHEPTAQEIADASSDEAPSVEEAGNYYNYCAATAGEICEDSIIAAGEATTDICPKGWRLPTGYYDGEQMSLTNGVWQDGDTTYLKEFNSVSAGLYNSGSIINMANTGTWWSSSEYNPESRYYMKTNYNNLWIWSGDEGGRQRGRSIRCILAEPNKRIATMQEYTPETCAVEAVNRPVTLEDERDGKTYTVRYINGNCWMTQNLALGSEAKSIKLTPDDTNIVDDPNTSEVESFTLPKSSNGSTAWSSSGEGHTIPRIHVPTQDEIDESGRAYASGYVDGSITLTTTGNYYNYAAATAGTITGYNNHTTATQDICPAGWRLPTYDEQVGLRDGTVVTDGTSTNNSSLFSPVYSGQYQAPDILRIGYEGYWWSSKVIPTGTHYFIMATDCWAVTPAYFAMLDLLLGVC